jgi:hypothetical protein
MIDVTGCTEVELRHIIAGCTSIASLMKTSNKPDRVARREYFAKLSDICADELSSRVNTLDFSSGKTLATMTLDDMTVTERKMEQWEIDEIDAENKKHGIW